MGEQVDVGKAELKTVIGFVNDVLRLMDRQILEMAEKRGIVARDALDVFRRTNAFKDFCETVECKSWISSI